MPRNLDYFHYSIRTGLSNRNQTLYSLGQSSILLTHISKPRLKIQSAEIGLPRPPEIFEAGTYSIRVIPWAPISGGFFVSFFLSHRRLGLPCVWTGHQWHLNFVLKLCHPCGKWASMIHSPI